MDKIDAASLRPTDLSAPKDTDRPVKFNFSGIRLRGSPSSLSEALPTYTSASSTKPPPTFSSPERQDLDGALSRAVCWNTDSCNISAGGANRGPDAEQATSADQKARSSRSVRACLSEIHARLDSHAADHMQCGAERLLSTWPAFDAEKLTSVLVASQETSTACLSKVDDTSSASPIVETPLTPRSAVCMNQTMIEETTATTVEPEAYFREALNSSMSGKDNTVDQAQGHLLNMWWGLIQDQMGTLTRELDSLRVAKSQIQVRQTEAMMLRSDDLAKVNDVSTLVAQLTEDQSCVRAALDAEMQKTESMHESLKGLKVEMLQHTTISESQQQLIAQLRTIFDEKVEQLKAAQLEQGEQLLSALSMLRDDVRGELDRQASALTDLNHEVNTNRTLLNQMSDEQTSLKTFLQAESCQRALCEQNVDELRMELNKCESATAVQHRNHSQLRKVVDEQVGDIKASQRTQVELLHSALSNLTQDMRSELDRHASMLCSLQHDLEQESCTRVSGEEELAEASRKLVNAVEHEQSEQGTRSSMLQSQLEQLGMAVEAERQEWSQRCNDLQAKMVQYLSEQENLLISERETREEQQAEVQQLLQEQSNDREQQMQDLLQQLVEEKNTRSKSMDILNMEVQKVAAVLTDIVSEQKASLVELQNSLQVELQKHVEQMSTSALEQTHALVNQAKLILDSDQALRTKIQAMLSDEVATKEEVAAEMKHIWEALKQRTPMTSVQYSVEPASTADILSARRFSSSPTPPQRSGSPIRRVSADGPVATVATAVTTALPPEVTSFSSSPRLSTTGGVMLSSSLSARQSSVSRQCSGPTRQSSANRMSSQSLTASCAIPQQAPSNIFGTVSVPRLSS